MNIKIIILAFLILFVLSGCSSQDSSSYDNYNESDYNDTSDNDEYTSENQEESDDTEYFNGYECIDDCSGHEAGYNWADEKGIDDIDDCGGKSQSFIEGCESYVEENY